MVKSQVLCKLNAVFLSVKIKIDRNESYRSWSRSSWGKLC